MKRSEGLSIAINNNGNALKLRKPWGWFTIGDNDEDLNHRGK
jgi:hypothetical protein